MNLRKTLGLYFLKTEMRTRKRNSKVVSFQNARSIGIIYPVGGEENQELIRQYGRYLKEERKRYHILGYVDRKEVGVNLKDSVGHSYFSRKDINWYMRPIRGNAQQFLGEEFDILIDLTLKESLPLRYICALSRAHFKVGRMEDGEDALYDLMISMNGQASMKELFKQIDHYLNIIQP